jgi:hypothetical protein
LTPKDPLIPRDVRRLLWRWCPGRLAESEWDVEAPLRIEVTAVAAGPHRRVGIGLVPNHTAGFFVTSSSLTITFTSQPNDWKTLRQSGPALLSWGIFESGTRSISITDLRRKGDTHPMWIWDVCSGTWDPLAPRRRRTCPAPDSPAALRPTSSAPCTSRRAPSARQIAVEVSEDLRGEAVRLKMVRAPMRIL